MSTNKTTKDEKKTAAKTKAKAPEQIKIEGTARRDRIEEIEDADTAYREARDARMEMQEEEASAQETLTNIMRKHGVHDYVYEAADGKRYKAYLPADVKAKSKRVTEPKAPPAAK